MRCHHEKTREIIDLESFVQARDHRERINVAGGNVVRDVDVESALLRRFHSSRVVKTSYVQFFYFYLKLKYPGEKFKLVYTDTDSFLLEIETKDVYANMVRDHTE